MESRNYTEYYLNLLMLPAIFISAVGSVLQSQHFIKVYDYGDLLLVYLQPYLLINFRQQQKHLLM